uniref:Uncharacterized protein n=1 Tax=Picea glauca TaxID=3330 RepID=A0A101M4H2_PICGL|nr:hypothetical protein ABT39_MTgene752 [Picea glauca]QHR90470.1 hypothetical protein Q903MT_gene4494 [Picea sitchensis]
MDGSITVSRTGRDAGRGNGYKTQRDAASLDAAGSKKGTVTVSYGSPMGSRKEQNQGPQSLCLSMREDKALEITAFLFVSHTFDGGSTSPGTG